MCFNLSLLLVYWLTSYAIAYIFVEKEDFQIVRDFFLSHSTMLHPLLFKFIDGVLNCVYCFSFWVGLVLGLFLFGWFGIFTALSCFGFTLVFHQKN